MEGRNDGGMEGNQRERGKLWHPSSDTRTHTGMASGAAWLAQAADSVLPHSVCCFLLLPFTCHILSHFLQLHLADSFVLWTVCPPLDILFPPYVLLTPPHLQPNPPFPRQ